MKIGLLFLIVAALFIGYCIGKAVRNAIKRRQAQELARARFVARWEVFADPENDQIEVGVRKIARVGKKVEVIETQVLTRVPCALSQDERDLEVRIAKADARAYADTLNS